MTRQSLFKKNNSFRIVACMVLVFANLPESFAWQMEKAPITTDWALLVDTNAPLPEYPRPQMVRPEWKNLNGIWQFQAGAQGDPVPTNQTLDTEILVPFPMESALSGVAEHHPYSWYRREFTVPSNWVGQRVLLHLDAVDWESEVFINGQSVGIHKGGYDEIAYDITTYLVGTGPQELIVRVYDPTDNYGQPRGKQTLSPGGIMYTSTSGIWRTVWLEPVPTTSIGSIHLTPDIDNNRLLVNVDIDGATSGIQMKGTAFDGSDPVASTTVLPGQNLYLNIPSPKLWSPTNPFLYDIQVSLVSNSVPVDSVVSYFGMRKISLGTRNGFVKMLLNNEFVFQFGPLDQGFWPDGIYTAPTDAALKSDIEQAKLFGYNMIRKHIKVEPARWYYWADKLGMLVWQDMPSVNSYTGNPQPIDAPQFETELTRMIESHWNHPSIISWVIFNESQGQHDTESLVALAHSLDASRLINQASGGSFYGVGDILDWHSYPNPSCPSSDSQAVVCGEFGGLGLQLTNHIWAPGWGYGELLSNADELATGFENFCLQLSDFVENRGLSAAVYTEITDVEIELNGFLTYDRKVRKPEADRIRAAVAQASTPVQVTELLPTSETTGQSWKYRFNEPSSNWTSTNYNDSTANWSTGLGGFGSGEPPQTVGYTRTSWTTSDIWLRRTFNPGPLTAQQISNLYFAVFNDEDVEIYINGVLAGSATGYRTSYGLMAVNEAGRSAIMPNTVNVLAVHCHQTSGGQYIDVGISEVVSAVNLPPRPLPTVPVGLTAKAGATGVGIGWDASEGATHYTIRRSTVSGGPYTDALITSPVNAVTDTSAAFNTTYYYVVTAENATGVSDQSEEISVTTPAPPPPVVPKVKAWFKADSIEGLNNGAPVDVWPDSSGEGANATQPTLGQQPTFVTGVINGLPAVRFDSANNTYLSFTRPVEDDFTIFCVFQSAQGIGTGTHFYQGAGLVNGEVANVVNDYGLCLNANGEIIGGTGNPDIEVVSASGFNNGQPHLVTFTRNRETGEIELWVDGESQGTNIGGQQSLTSPDRLVIGAQQTEIYYLSGDIAEVKIYDAALTDTDRIAEEGALNCKYGLGSGPLPATPANLQLTVGNREVLVEWDQVLGATAYKLNRSEKVGGPYFQLSGNVQGTSFLDASPVMDATNYYQVAAFNACGVSAFSAPAGVLVPSPELAVDANVSSGSITLSWPDWADDWTLFSATNLAQPISWEVVTNTVYASNGALQMILPIQSGNEFFQLVSP